MSEPTELDPEAIAVAFAVRWKTVWNEQGPAATAALYTPDSVLVGRAMASSRPEIARALQAMYDQGWTTLSIKVANARSVGDVVLLAAEFTAFGAGANAGKTLTGRSSHVLVRVGEEWLSAMHSAA